MNALEKPVFGQAHQHIYRGDEKVADHESSYLDQRFCCGEMSGLYLLTWIEISHRQRKVGTIEKHLFGYYNNTSDLPFHDFSSVEFPIPEVKDRIRRTSLRFYVVNALVVDQSLDVVI